MTAIKTPPTVTPRHGRSTLQARPTAPYLTLIVVGLFALVRSRQNPPPALRELYPSARM